MVWRNGLSTWIDVNGNSTLVAAPPSPFTSPQIVDISGDGNTLVGTLRIGEIGSQLFLYDRPAETDQIVDPAAEILAGVEVALQFTAFEAISTDGSTVGGIANDPLEPNTFDAILVDAAGSVSFLGVLDARPGRHLDRATAGDGRGDASGAVAWRSAFRGGALVSRARELDTREQQRGSLIDRRSR